MAFDFDFSSQLGSPEWSDVGESAARLPFVVCMSSISILEAARSAAVGIMDQMPRTRLKKKIALGYYIRMCVGMDKVGRERTS